MSDLQVFTIAVPGGINQSSPQPDPTDFEELDNFVVYRNRLALRAPITHVGTVLSNSSNLAVDGILDMVVYPDVTGDNQLYILSWSDDDDTVELHSMTSTGSVAKVGVVHTSVTARPDAMKMVPFAGGAADTPNSRLWIVDYEQILDTKYWDGPETPTSFVTPTVDLDLDDTAENLTFSLMQEFKYHLWGTGFYDANTIEPNMLRFSEPGVIPATDTAGGTPTSKEFRWANHRSVGQRGDKITAVEVAGDRMVVFQRARSHGIYGSGELTWTRQELSNRVGCVGPNALTSVDDRIVYFWSKYGPYRTDGSFIQYLGDPIKDLVSRFGGLGSGEDRDEWDLVAGYNSEDGLVYFVLSLQGINEYSQVLMFDHRRERWATATFHDTASADVQFGAMATLDQLTAPGPTAAPSAPSASATSHSSITVSWTNGDTSIDNVTHVYRSTSTPLTPDDATNLVGVVEAGVDSFVDTGLSSRTQYWYELRHYRNGTHSTGSAEVTDTTWLAPTTTPGLAGLTNGLTYTGVNNEATADIVIQRSLDGVTGWGQISESPLTTPGAGSFSVDNVSDITCGTRYFYRSRAEEAGFTSSEWSDTVTRRACLSTTAPTAPTLVTPFTTTTSTIVVVWTDNSDDENGFDVEWKTSTATSYTTARAFPNVTTYTVTGLDSNTLYDVRVRAINGAGESAYASTQTSTLADLDPPTTASGFTAVAISSSEILVTWTSLASDAIEHIVAWEKTGLGFTELAPGSYPNTAHADGPTGLTFTITGLEASTTATTVTYDVKVRARYADQYGAYSDEITGIAMPTGDGPAAPTLSAATSVTDTNAQINWTDNSTNETSWIFSYREDGESVWNTATATSSTVTGTGVRSTTFSTLGVTLQAGTTYNHKVAAKNSSGTAESSVLNITTTGTAGKVSDPISFTALGDDADLSGVQKQQVDTTWAHAGVAPVNFEIQRATGTSSSSYATVSSSIAATATSYSDNSVSEDDEDITYYRYRIRALGASPALHSDWTYPNLGFNIALTSASNASPIVVTSTVAHGLSTGDWVQIKGVTGNDAANGGFFITVTGTNTLTLDGTTGTGSGTGGGMNESTATEVEPTTGASQVTSSDNSYCDGPSPVARLFISWVNGDMTDHTSRVLQYSKDGGSWTDTGISLGPSNTNTNHTGLSFGSSYRYRIRDTFSGENTGTFTSNTSTTRMPSEPDCGEEI